MKTYSKLLTILLLTAGTGSCGNDLTENVYSSVTEQSYNYGEKDFAPIVASVYPPLRNVCDHWGYFCAQEVTADAIVMPPNASGWDDGGVYRRMHYQTWTSEQDHVNNMWSWFYRGALIANNVIEQIESGTVPAPSSAEKERGLAEVRAMRAWYYWMICDNYGDAPLVTSRTGDLPAKTPRQEIYNFIVAELNEVIPALSDEQGGSMYGRMSRWAAKALLANIYLNAGVYAGQARWEECIAQCDDIINSGRCALSPDFRDPFRATGVENSKEVLFTVPFDKNLAGGNSLHMFSWHGELKNKFQTEATPWGSGCAMGVSQFIDTYEVGDSRLEDSWLLGEQLAADGSPLFGVYDQKGEPLVLVKDLPSASFTKETEGYRMNKFEVEPGSTSGSTTDVPLFRYAQVLMMKAECLLRLGRPGAGDLVTQVRQRAFRDDPSKAAVTDEQLQANSSYSYGYVENYAVVDPGDRSPVQFGRMYDELGWEFAWEMYRRRDAIRFGVYTTKSWLSHRPQGDYRAVFPIPEQVITSNPNLEQNPNYGRNQ
ncbi:MAG: RagB/SusD family nutrient uptake outer membrane protein [Tannerella sp.]|jgi:hypothetical protein|nr:RagB/SusD family nutrient uptake outer membrane protein [Tannerella sp.]